MFRWGLGDAKEEPAQLTSGPRFPDLPLSPSSAKVTRLKTMKGQYNNYFVKIPEPQTVPAEFFDIILRRYLRMIPRDSFERKRSCQRMRLITNINKTTRSFKWKVWWEWYQLYVKGEADSEQQTNKSDSDQESQLFLWGRFGATVVWTEAAGQGRVASAGANCCSNQQPAAAFYAIQPNQCSDNHDVSEKYTHTHTPNPIYTYWSERPVSSIFPSYSHSSAHRYEESYDTAAADYCNFWLESTPFSCKKRPCSLFSHTCFKPWWGLQWWWWW